ncbi:hypothetical protein INT47_008157 [Mucor saturninus]|uniref:Reverse transcriptase domain-containing protein n=1 Tax=Mucor saturninus TaxID=64648 RepID=A0A8H7QQY4_9FUNG|nr:hypothetical protein INT47_008157 [Mucor saturninus]
MALSLKSETTPPPPPKDPSSTATYLLVTTRQEWLTPIKLLKQASGYMRDLAKVFYSTFRKFNDLKRKSSERYIEIYPYNEILRKFTAEGVYYDKLKPRPLPCPAIKGDGKHHLARSLILAFDIHPLNDGFWVPGMRLFSNLQDNRMPLSNIQLIGMKRNTAMQSSVMCLLGAVAITLKTIPSANVKKRPLVYCATLVVNMVTVQLTVLTSSLKKKRPDQSKKPRKTYKDQSQNEDAKPDASEELMKSKWAPSIETTINEQLYSDSDMDSFNYNPNDKIKDTQSDNEDNEDEYGTDTSMHAIHSELSSKSQNATQGTYKTLKTFVSSVSNIQGDSGLFFNNTVYVNINGYFTDAVSQKRGLRQGDPLSPLLFNLALEPFILSILQDDSITGFQLPSTNNTASIPIKCLAFADDVCAIIQDALEMDGLEYQMDKYAKVSNAKFNEDKSEAFSLNEVFRPTITIFTFNTEISWFLLPYSAQQRQSLESKLFFKTIRSTVYQFIWQKKKPSLRLELTFLPYELGGLKVLDPVNQHKILQKRWLNYLLTPTGCPSFAFPIMLDNLSHFQNSSLYPLLPLFDPEFRKSPVLNKFFIWHVIFETFEYFQSSTKLQMINLPVPTILTLPLRKVIQVQDSSHWSLKHRNSAAGLFLIFDEQQQRLRLRVTHEFSQFSRLCQTLANDILCNRTSNLKRLYGHIFLPRLALRYHPKVGLLTIWCPRCDFNSYVINFSLTLSEGIIIGNVQQLTTSQFGISNSSGDPRNTAHEFELASLRVKREALKDVVSINQGEGCHDTEVFQAAGLRTEVVQAGYYTEEVRIQAGHQTEVVQETGYDTHNTEVFQEAGAKSNPFINVFTPVEQTEFEKLNNSNCLNFISHSFRTYYKHTMSANDYSEIIERSSELREEFDNGLDEADKKMIDNLFLELEVFANKEHKFCEATFVRKFQEILDILFKNTKIFAKDSESSSEAAKSNQITNEDGTHYGRKLDVLVLSEQNDHDDIEVCSNEFKNRMLY